MKLRHFRKYLQWLSYYILPGFLLVQVLFLGADQRFFIELGGPALSLLIFILFLTPVTQILNWRILQILMTWRREFGIAAFWFFLFHGAGLIYVMNLTDIGLYLSPQGYLFWGAVAGIGMLILGLTSNDSSVKLLRRNWKRVQYVAIPTLFFAQAHASMAEEGTIIPAVALFSFYIVLRMLGAYVVKRRMALSNSGHNNS